MKEIRNPVLPGFNPDPSILRVGGDYYIATSTFEWFPGVQIHHSKDLAHWRLLTRPLRRVSQLDMAGATNSAGVWAPCLTYDKGTFYLAYTNVGYFDRTLFAFDTPNYLVTAKDIAGEWSDPVYLNASGFDPSLFHDDDGKKWLVNMLWDHRKAHKHFAGIVLQEYSPKEKKLIGPVHHIFGGTSLGVTEGPHLYKENGFYYLLTAEGGTGYGHAVTVARSKKITGPYETDPENPVLTSRNDADLEIQKAGHASLVMTAKKEWYLAHLGSRPLTERGRCVLGRETFLQKAAWNRQHWLRLESEGKAPQMNVPAAAGLVSHPWPKPHARDDFDAKSLNIHFQTLRVPLGEDTLSLRERPGFLRLKGRKFLSSPHTQALVARRQQSFRYSASTVLEFDPENFQQMAGLVCFYDTQNFYYLHVSHDEKLGKCLNLISSDRGNTEYPMDGAISLKGTKRVSLKVEVNREKLQFFYSKDGRVWRAVGPMLDASKLSDDYASDFSFTGAFVGLACQDLSGRRHPADFDYFDYTEHDS